MQLKNKTAIVTGGASGIGKEIARAFVEAGAMVAIADYLEPQRGIGKVVPLARASRPLPLAPVAGGSIVVESDAYRGR